MSYLPFQDLKNSRLVSKPWRDEASKFLKKKSNFVLQYNDYYSRQNHALFNYFQSSQEFSLNSWGLSFPQ